MLKSVIAAAALLTVGTTSSQAGVLSTGFSITAGTSAAAFDISIGSQDLTITALGFNLQENPGVQAFIRSGSFVGNLNSPTGWTEIFNDNTLVPNGTGTETVLDVADMLLQAGQTYGIAVVVQDHLEIESGTRVGNTVVSNADLSILEGESYNAKYGNPFPGRAPIPGPDIVQTSVYYDVEAIPLPADLVLLASALAVVGIANFRGKAQQA